MSEAIAARAGEDPRRWVPPDAGLRRMARAIRVGDACRLPHIAERLRGPAAAEGDGRRGERRLMRMAAA